MEYLDFELSVEHQPTSPEWYVVRILESPAGEATTKVSEEYFEPCDHGGAFSDVIYGTQLFHSLMNGPILERYRESEGMVSGHDPTRGLRLLIRANVPRVDDVCWEMLCDPGNGVFLAQCQDRPLVRYVETAEPDKLVQKAASLRILGVAAPSKDAPLAAGEEIRRIQEALNGPIVERQVELVWLKRPTREALRQALSRQVWHVLHFVGHSGADAEGNTTIQLEHQDGSQDAVKLKELSTLLHDCGFRLVVLNSCEGALAGGVSGFASFAEQLVECGVPAAIGMRGRIGDAAAITFAERFYADLAQGHPVETAMVEARKALATSGMNGGQARAWSMPILYMHTRDGHLFKKVEEVSSPTRGILDGSVDRLHRLWMEHPWRAALLVFLWYFCVMVGAGVLGIGPHFKAPRPAAPGGLDDADGFFPALMWGKVLPWGIPLAAVLMSYYLCLLSTRFARLDSIMRPRGGSILFSESLSRRVQQQWPWLFAFVLGLSIGITLVADAGYLFAPTEYAWLKFPWLSAWTEFDWSNAGHLRPGGPSRWWYFAFNIAAYASQTFLIYCAFLMLVVTTYLFGTAIGKGLAQTELMDIFGIRGEATAAVALFEIEWHFKHKRCGLQVLDQIFLTFHLLVFVAMCFALGSVLYNIHNLQGADLGSRLLVAFTLTYVPIDVIWILYPYWSRFPKELPPHLKGKPDYVEPSPWPFGSKWFTWTVVFVVSAMWLTVAACTAWALLSRPNP